MKRLRARGVRAGFLKKEVAELAPLFGALGPRVVVIDYAENRLGEVREILGRLAEDNERERHRPFRLVLLARGAGEWWDGLAVDDYRCGVLLANHGQQSILHALVPETEDRQALYERAIEELAATLPPATAPVSAPSLDAPHFAQGLYVLMAALAALAGKSVADAGDLLDFMLEHERRYWRGAAKELELAGAVRNAFVRGVERSVVLLTLWGGRRAASEVRDAVEMAAHLPAGHEHLLDEIVDTLRRLYGGNHGIRGLEPDLIGEHLVQRALEHDTDSVLRGAVEGAGAAGSTSLLTVLDRLARRRPEAVEWLRAALRLDLAKLAMTAIEVALATGDPAGVVLAEVLEEAGSVPVAEAIVRLVDDHHEQTVVLRETAATATRMVLDARRGEGMVDTDAISDMARLASNLGNRLSALGRREAALEATQEALELYRKLAARHPDVFLPELAMTLSNLGHRLSVLGRREAALGSTQEALEIQRKLAEQRPDVFVPHLAATMNNLGNELSELGRREAALQATQEAVEMRRKLAEQRPDTFLPDLAASLSNLAIRLSDLGRPAAALTAAQEAVAIRRQLAEQRPDAFLPDLAESLNSLGGALNSLGREEAALETAQETLEIYRQLAGRRPEAFLSYLATSLNNVGIVLSALGRRDAAVKAAQEAVEIQRQLAEQHPDAFLPDLAMSLGAMGTILLRGGNGSIARDHFASGIHALGPLYLRTPAAHGILMGKLVTAYLQACHVFGQEPDDELLAPVLSALR